LRRAILGCLSAWDIKTVKDAIHRKHSRVVEAKPYGGPIYEMVHAAPAPVIERGWQGRDEDLEFLILLRAAAWLRVEAQPPYRHISMDYQMVFHRTSLRLAQLLDGGGTTGTKGDTPSSRMPGYLDGVERSTHSPMPLAKFGLLPVVSLCAESHLFNLDDEEPAAFPDLPALALADRSLR
jgi:predicted metal-dependent hydrolase